MAFIRRLERTLAGTVPLNKARRNFLAKFVVALLALTFCWAVVVSAWLVAQKPLRVKKHGRKYKSLFRHGLDHLRRIVCNLTSAAKLADFRRAIQLLSCA